jgi:hypothetical protein
MVGETQQRPGRATLAITEVSGEFRTLLDTLEHAQLFWFADWPVAAVPRSSALVYTVWNRPAHLCGNGSRGETSAAQIRVDGSGRRTFRQMAMGLVA